MIARIEGEGRRYHALDSRAYGWVHMAFLDTSLTLAAMYGSPLSHVEAEQLFAEWHQGGGLLGLRDRDLPRDLDDYRRRFDETVASELEYTEVVANLLAEHAVPPPPPWATRLPGAVWPALWRPVGATSRWLTLAALPRAYRDRIHAVHPWTDADERRFTRVRALVRAAATVLPARLRSTADARRTAA